MNKTNLFSSIKILDLTRVFSGPFATRHFADFGAKVIKIEPPQGDDSRNFPPIVNNWSGYFEILNRNKESLILNLKTKHDLNIFYSLCKTCDVIVENYSSDVKRNLKIDYETILKFNSNIIYASVSGISDNINRKYYDIIAQAESGLISLNGKKENMKISTSVIDAFSGMKLAFAISSALYSRQKNKKGCAINISMKGSALDLLEQNLITTSISNKNPKKIGNMDNAIAPFGIFRCSDSDIVIAIGNEVQWKKFEIFLQKNNQNFNKNLFLNNTLRIKNIKRLKSNIEFVLNKYLSKQIVSILDEMGIPCSQVKTMTQVLEDKENYNEKLLEKISHPIAGEIAVSTGGIFFSNYKKEKYINAPSLGSKKNDI